MEKEVILKCMRERDSLDTVRLNRFFKINHPWFCLMYNDHDLPFPSSVSFKDKYAHFITGKK
jgi:hypothetical protein